MKKIAPLVIVIAFLFSVAVIPASAGSLPSAWGDDIPEPPVVLREIPPATPLDLSATTTPLSTTSSLGVTLHWRDTSWNEDGFHVERGVDGTNFSLIGIAPANFNRFLDLPGLPGTYYYRVRAFNSVGTSGYSNITSVTIR